MQYVRRGGYVQSGVYLYMYPGIQCRYSTCFGDTLHIEPRGGGTGGCIGGVIGDGITDIGGGSSRNIGEERCTLIQNWCIYFYRPQYTRMSIC
uniref:Uncharacterized protein n=1 Tax=Penaeus monodon majanivirus B TaxID=2984272 RepID=A0A9C7F7H4_9VIRU|nr:MAG: hypothetical protein [Penaeus monodon majanivirus B]